MSASVPTNRTAATGAAIGAMIQKAMHLMCGQNGLRWTLPA